MYILLKFKIKIVDKYNDVTCITAFFITSFNDSGAQRYLKYYVSDSSRSELV